MSPDVGKSSSELPGVCMFGLDQETEEFGEAPSPEGEELSRPVLSLEYSEQEVDSFDTQQFEGSTAISTVDDSSHISVPLSPGEWERCIVEAVELTQQMEAGKASKWKIAREF